MSNNRSIFSRIPVEINYKILANLHAKDICSISLVDRYLYNLCNEDYVWQLMCIYQYPNSRILEVKKSTSTLSTHEWKDLYKKLTKLVKFMAEERNVCWLDDDNQTYWKTEEDNSSECGKVIHLNYVWWFDVFSKIQCVQPGTYNVLWRIKVDKNFYGLDNMKFTVTVNSNAYQENSESIILSEESCVISNNTFKDIAEMNDWVEYHVPIRAIDIPDGGIDEWYDVECKIHEDRICKSGIWIDSIRLVRLCKTPLRKEDQEKSIMEWLVSFF
ncbi:hypothetical protein Glove_621g63 [Diversispora epigaea]|uniref:F-box domain-containing protein n=1 Tax=Diversispora epigaea TaxID=1348612 RepID=A0A397G5X3_9GLOM|nr:hypothetical protein Glove_621g63 [Diversispora epigaea]